MKIHKTFIIIPGIILGLTLLFPVISQAQFASPWIATSTSQGWIVPNRVSGVDPAVVGKYFIATSTSFISRFPYASTTALSTDTLCLSSDCKSAWPTGGGVGWATTTDDSESIYFYGMNEVGVGTTSPYSKLSVFSDTNDTNSIASFGYMRDTSMLTLIEPKKDNTIVVGGTFTSTSTCTANARCMIFAPTGGTNFYYFSSTEFISRGANVANMFGSTATVGYVGTGTNHNLALRANNSDIMTLTGAGVVTITGTLTTSSSITSNSGGIFAGFSSATLPGLRLTAAAAHTADIIQVNRTGSTPHLILSQFGSLGLGTTSPLAILSVTATSSTDTRNLFALAHGSGTATTTDVLVDTTGKVTLNSLTQATGGTNNDLCINGTTNDVVEETTGTCIVSSERFKHDIKSLTVSGTDLVKQLNPVSFAPNDDAPFDYENVQYGLTAEGVASVDPHLAKYGIDGLPRTLDDRALLSVLIKAVQEQQVTIESLQKEISKLKKQK